MRRLLIALVAIVLVVGGSTQLFAQGFQGGIRGAVKDSGGVIPGVEVTLTNDSTSVARSTTSNDAGEYNFPNLQPGAYTLTTSLQGYKTYKRAGLTVGTQQFLTLDVTLEVGSLDETITVTAQAPLIETSNASTGTTLDNEVMSLLPSQARTAFMMGTTVPTVVPSGDAQFNRQQDQTNVALMSLGGGARRGNNYTLDGVPITDMRNRASAHPSIESLEDVKVQVHTYDSEMGRTGGGVFNTTLKSGTNSFKGNGFYQVRPIWAQTNNYFSEKAGRAKPESPYRLAGGAVGGPIVKNRTFFWFATEGYDDTQTRNVSVLFPSSAMRTGDFSGLTDGSGQAVTIYDPLTGQAFPGNRIPANRINPVAANMLKYLPLPDTDRDNGSTNYTRTSLIKSKYAQLYSIKLEHKLTDKVSLSGFYLYNKTQEPCSNYFGSADQNEPNRFADPDDYLLVRTPQILALNNTWVLSNTSVLALRFGKTSFPDNNTLSADFDPRTLGFSQTYTNQIQLDKFPQVRIRGYDAEGRTMGAINPTEIDWKSTSANATYSKLIGAHTIKAGGDWRKIGVDTYIPGDGAGYFDFDKDMTSSNGGTGSTTDGNAFASFLLGYPSSLSTRETRLSVSTPLNLFTNYFGGFVQDDWRVSSKLTVNYGLRLEHERGLSERDNNFSVGWDPKMTSPLSAVTIAADPLSGAAARTVAGGLMYAGVNGNKTYQGNAPNLKWSPRLGAAYSVDSKTVIRGGYGLYWAPLNFAPPSTATNNYGQVGFSQNTILTSSRSNPTSLSNPFPTGIAQPTGNTLGALTNLNSNISFVDQNRTAPRIQQYSVDVQRELGGSWALALTYMGARGDDLTLGGASDDIGININQLDPKYLALGATALNEQLPNPFRGNPNVPLSLSTPTTLSRARLLLPHPQYGQINARQVTEGYSRYQAGVIELTRRMSHGFGGRFNYTYSVLKDNQFGETNFYSSVSPALAVNNYNYIASMPACSGNQFTTACYDPSSEYGYGIVDTPHRFNIVPVFELPFGTGKKWAQGPVADRILGGWTVSAAMSFQSGFPINIQQAADAILGGQNAKRPNLSGADLETSGDFYDRLASADHSTATWLNPAAFTLAPFGVFGNTPRTITDVRTPSQRNVDASIIKNVRLTGSKTATLKMEIINLLNRPNVR
ncbi:MAG: carboxypeptidase-like regulatory domain-containing protein, partial [Vicinamibacterales bacterium]